MTTDVGLHEVSRMFRVHVDPLTNGPRPSNRRSRRRTLHLMDKDETREVIRHVVQNLAPKLIHEAFCEPTRRKPPLAIHRKQARDQIFNHRKQGEVTHKRDMTEFCRGLLLSQQGGHTLSQFPTARFGGILSVAIAGQSGRFSNAALDLGLHGVKLMLSVF